MELFTLLEGRTQFVWLRKVGSRRNRMSSRRKAWHVTHDSMTRKGVTHNGTINLSVVCKSDSQHYSWMHLFGMHTWRQVQWVCLCLFRLLRCHQGRCTLSACDTSLRKMAELAYRPIVSKAQPGRPWGGVPYMKKAYISICVCRISPSLWCHVFCNCVKERWHRIHTMCYRLSKAIRRQ